ncbi:MAG: UvrD-helicase domain-containing protein [Puniceicoccales bacterium]|jgi:superfamily I DNA/RNA helicase|nr:UvrD-helicase domain-containing protein [Puniceicoccales bacterium]
MLADQNKRDEFTKNLSQNFSVIASPGTGKTMAITERIANLVRSSLPVKNFIAVTYTDRAAKEIRERVWARIFASEGSSEAALKNFNGIFFGTIHGFCAKFLREHCARINLNRDFEIIDDDRELWLKFTARLDGVINKIVPPELRSCLASHFKFNEILRRVREMATPAACGGQFEPVPMRSISELLAYKAAAKEDRIRNFQEDLKVWMGSRDTCSFPELGKIGEKKCGNNFHGKMGEYLRWKAEMEQLLAAKIFEEYTAFKIFNNRLCYNDLTNLTLKILLDRGYGEKHVPNHNVILDEAQDSDEIQFKILLNLVSPNFYEKIFSGGEWSAPQLGSFSMVGDPKQSIYADRADVKFYISVHNGLASRKFLKQLDFNVTMRCASEIVEFANAKFEHAFADSAVEFVPMRAKPGAQRGYVEMLRGESVETLAKILSGKACGDLGVAHFSDLCVLAPRKSWLSEIATLCRSSKTLPKMQLSFSESLENSPSLPKWTASILHFLNNICDRRELAGMLREIFGISTAEVIKFFNHSDSVVCESIFDELITLKHEQNHLSLPNFVRRIMDKFHLVARLKLLDIFLDGEIDEHYESIMDATYQPSLGCDELEKKLVEMYKNPQTSPLLDRDAIQLLSFHKSKGLEWPVVILPFMHRERKLMNSKSGSGSDALENERRLLFVACTRAKEKLILVDDCDFHRPSHRSNMVSSASLMDSFTQK